MDLHPSAAALVLALALGCSGLAGCGGKVEADPPAPPATALPTGARGARGLAIESLTKPPPAPAPPASALVPGTVSGTPDTADAGPPVEVP